MTFVTRTNGAGLVLAETSRDQASLQRALKQIDDRLVLHAPDEYSGPYWKVYRVWSDSHEPACVCTWMDANGDPLPLSSGILDEVQKWRPENREKRGPDTEQRNEQRKADVRKLQDDNTRAIVEEHRPRVERARLQVGMSTDNRRRGGLR